MGQRLSIRFLAERFASEADSAQMGERVRLLSQRIAVATRSAQMGDAQAIFRSRRELKQFFGETLGLQATATANKVKDEAQALLVNNRFDLSVRYDPKHAFSGQGVKGAAHVLGQNPSSTAGNGSDQHGD